MRNYCHAYCHVRVPLFLSRCPFHPARCLPFIRPGTLPDASLHVWHAWPLQSAGCLKMIRNAASHLFEEACIARGWTAAGTLVEHREFKTMYKDAMKKLQPKKGRYLQLLITAACW